MPRHVDHDHRRQEIIDATYAVLADKGPSRLSFRSIAEHMGGSSTLITHYFRSKQALLDSLVESITSWPEEIAEIEAGSDDPRVRLQLFLRWLMPEDAAGLREESVRINLLGERDTKVRTDHIFAAWDSEVRALIAKHLEGLVPPDRVPAIVDVLRSTTNGVTLSVVEHPDEWSMQRQHAVLDEVLVAFDLAPKS